MKAGRKSLPLKQIHIDTAMNCRVDLNQTAIADYADALQRELELPPVIVFFDGLTKAIGGLYWLADGFHRFEAHKLCKKEKIACEVRRGTKQDALWYAISANQAHGLPRTAKDKEKAIKAALLHPKGVGMPDTQIAAHVGVSDKTVAKHRAELESRSEIPNVTTRTDTRGRNQPAKKKRKVASGTAPIPKLYADILARLPEEQRDSCFRAAKEKYGKVLTSCWLQGMVDLWEESNKSTDKPVCEPFDRAAVLAKQRAVQADIDGDEPIATPQASRGKGVQLANEAINALKRIPKDDELRERAFEIVTAWITHNR